MALRKQITRVGHTILTDLIQHRHMSSLSQILLKRSQGNCKGSASKKQKKETDFEVEDRWCVMRCSPHNPVGKVTVVGAGAVGMSIVNCVLMKGLCKHIVIIDTNFQKLEGECMEYRYSEPLLHGCRIEGCNADYSVSCNSNVVIIAAGVRQQKNESRLDILNKNVEVFKDIIPPLLEYNPDAVFLIVSNPVDVLTWVTWKLTCLPFFKVMGCGTFIDSMRFTALLSQKLQSDSRDLNAMILGEHGDSQVPIWSKVCDKSELLRNRYPDCGLCPDDPFYQIAEAAREAGPKIRSLKGYTTTTVCLCIADMLKSLLHDDYRLRPISTLAMDQYGIKEEVFMSLPCHIDNNGLYRVYNYDLDECELKKLKESAKILYKAQCQVKL